MASFEFQQRQTQRDFIERALGQLSGTNIGRLFEELKGMFGPEFDAIMRNANLTAQTQERGIMAELGRAGLQQGPGLALAAGARAGTMNAANTTRAQLISQLLNNALQVQGQRADILGQNASAVFQQQQQPGAFDKALNFATMGLSTVSNLMGKNNQGSGSDYDFIPRPEPTL